MIAERYITSDQDIVLDATGRPGQTQSFAETHVLSDRIILNVERARDPGDSRADDLDLADIVNIDIPAEQELKEYDKPPQIVA